MSTGTPVGRRSRRRTTVSRCTSLVGRWRWHWRWIWCGEWKRQRPWTSRRRAAGWSVRAAMARRTGRRRRDLSTLSSCLRKAVRSPRTWSQVECTRSATGSTHRHATSRPGQRGWASCWWSIAGLQLISCWPNSVILIDSSTGSPVHVLMLSIQAVRGLPCTWHCSFHYLLLQTTPLFPHGVTILC